jgi:8-oxo-dGTP pyrophosphatase MutT (NUDIX family)/deoxyadenosine/deoxycytidine kinase
MITNSNKENINIMFSAVGCACFYNNMLLLLKREKNKSYPNHWGIPTGKIEKEESSIKAIVRELYEETNIILSSDRLQVIDTFIVSNEDMVFKYILYYTEFDSIPEININPVEHNEYQWVDSDAIDSFKLVPDVSVTIRYALQKRENKTTQLKLFQFEDDYHPKVNIKLEEYLKDSSGLYNKNQANKNWMVSLGPPGSGKTTSLKALNKSNNQYYLISDNSKILKKDTRLKKYLNEALRNSKLLYFFYFQMEILPERFKESFNCPNNSLVDETIFSTLAYSTALYYLNWINKEQFEIFMNNYQLLLKFLPTPTEIFYFHCNTVTLLNRIKSRDRKIEYYFTIEYLDALNKSFYEVASELVRVGYNVTYIDTEEQRTKKIVDLLYPKLTKQWI